MLGNVVEPTKFKLENATNAQIYQAAKVEYGQTAGYHTCDLVYAGDLIANVGETVTSVFDKIKNMLGQFEYFYNLDKQEYIDSSATYRKKSTSKPHSSQAQTEQSVEMPHNTFSLTKQSVTSHTKPAIQPIFISDLQKYNVVVSSYNILANAQNECQTISDDGFFTNIYLDSSKIYRVLMYMGTNNENEAKAMRNKVRERFPAAWIMCVENDRTFRFE